MPKIFSFKGHSLEALKKMTIEYYARALTSRERRTLKRGLTDPQKKLLLEVRKNPQEFHKTHVREMIILPEMTGVKFGVYNGKEWVNVVVAPELIGKRLGDSAISIKRVKHSAPGIGATRGSKHIPL